MFGSSSVCSWLACKFGFGLWYGLFAVVLLLASDVSGITLFLHKIFLFYKTSDCFGPSFSKTGAVVCLLLCRNCPAQYIVSTVQITAAGELLGALMNQHPHIILHFSQSLTFKGTDWLKGS